MHSGSRTTLKCSIESIPVKTVCALPLRHDGSASCGPQFPWARQQGALGRITAAFAAASPTGIRVPSQVGSPDGICTLPGMNADVPNLGVHTID
jgi:hypothetical protein